MENVNNRTSVYRRHGNNSRYKKETTTQLEHIIWRAKKDHIKKDMHKTKTLIKPSYDVVHSIIVNGKKIEQVTSFNYTWSIVEENGIQNKEVNNKMCKAGGIYSYLKITFWKKIEVWKTNKSRRR